MRDTKKELLEAGYRIAKRDGFKAISYKSVCEEAGGVYRAGVAFHFEGMGKLRQAVAALGAERGDWPATADVPTVRKSAEDRRREILNEAVGQAVVQGLGNVTRATIAKALAVTDGLITRYFDGRAELLAAIVDEAIERNEAGVVANAIAMGVPIKYIPDGLRAQALEILKAP